MTSPINESSVDDFLALHITSRAQENFLSFLQSSVNFEVAQLLTGHAVWFSQAELVLLSNAS